MAVNGPIKAKELFISIGDVVAGDALYRSIYNEGADADRITTAAGMAAIGYAFGPELADWLKRSRDPELSGALQDSTKKNVLIGSIAGAIAGQYGGDMADNAVGGVKKAYTSIESLLEREDVQDKGPIASAAWFLGRYATKGDGEAGERPRYALAGGALGWLVGPKLQDAVGHLEIPGDAIADIQAYKTSRTIAGAGTGLLLAAYAANHMKKE